MAKCANRRSGILVAAVAAVGLVALPASVAASNYIWNVDASGSWTTPGNWLHAGGPIGAGYPNAAGDQAFFTGTYTANRTITIPNGVTATVGVIPFGTPVRSRLTAAVPIAVERSLYWNANGVFWAGGSNALGTPLP